MCTELCRGHTHTTMQTNSTPAAMQLLRVVAHFLFRGSRCHFAVLNAVDLPPPASEGCQSSIGSAFCLGKTRGTGRICAGRPCAPQFIDNHLRFFHFVGSGIVSISKRVGCQYMIASHACQTAPKAQLVEYGCHPHAFLRWDGSGAVAAQD
mmetsp:Transcript_12968/g.23604  ORF Transcript_12968/g.23604 Transcript_12968/m.23604 type:complete len:151 (-) Transcript_12968:419-871(-)